MLHARLWYKLLFVLSLLLLHPLSHYVETWRGLHRGLSRQLVHRSEIGNPHTFSNHGNDLTTLPASVIRDESQYVVLFDEAVKAIPVSMLPTLANRKLLTVYLRHNLGKFAKTPQAWILWMTASRDAKKTFNQDWIHRLDFEEGDQVCGSYTVLSRQDNRIEMGLSMGNPNSAKYVEGRLVISIGISNTGDMAIFTTQTFMWRRKDSGILMPLERRLPHWLHELASWWLIDEGTKYLTTLKEIQVGRCLEQETCET